MESSEQEEIIEATLVDDHEEGGIDQVDNSQVSVRTGSPFASDPPEVKHRARAYAARSRPFEAGLWSFTAGGAVLASGLLVPFVLASFWVFPAGAVAVAALGGVMGLIGLASFYPRWAIALLVLHIAGFVVSELRMWA